MILGTYAGGQAPRTDYNQTDPAKADYLVGREKIAEKDSIGTNKVFNKLTDIGITSFPTTMKTVADSMPANSTLMLDSRDIITGGTHEISDLGLANAGMYMIMRGNSNARISLLNIYGATTATTSYMNYGCYAATNNSVVWKHVDPSDFAPSGYGLGNIAYNLPEVTDANAATNNGWYLLGKDAANGFGYKGVMRVDAYSHSHLIQTLYTQGYSSKTPAIVQRTCVAGNWSEWAFLNPIVGVGAEYRTTELHQGKPVYTQLFNLGAVTASGSTDITIAGLTECIRYAGRIANVPLPVLSKTEMYVDAYTGGATIGWVCGHDNWIGRTAYCQIWYVKE